MLTLQNGLGNEDLLGKLLDPKQVIAGKTYIGGMMLAPGKVQSTTEGKQTFIGEYSGRSPAHRSDCAGLQRCRYGVHCFTAYEKHHLG